jgi:hypothetical protein
MRIRHGTVTDGQGECFHLSLAFNQKTKRFSQAWNNPSVDDSRSDNHGRLTPYQDLSPENSAKNQEAQGIDYTAIAEGMSISYSLPGLWHC